MIDNLSQSSALDGWDEIALPPDYSDDANALKFSERYKDELRFVEQWCAWVRFDGTRWKKEKKAAVRELARKVVRDISLEADVSDGQRIKLASYHSAANVEAEARGDRRHDADTDQWDRDQWLLNTPDGTVDLRNGGDLREHRRNDYLSKITNVGPDGDCPMWLKFIDRVTDGDKELQKFLQRVVGYVLTGSTREQALFFLYGTGKNGKSVFLNTLSWLLGEYAKTAPTSTFTACSSEQHPTDLAGLHGARLVTAIETEDGKQWAEAKIKSLTGGDPITCRFMRQDFWTYTPIFKLLIASNHKPTIRTVDEAIRRRIHLIPFTVCIPEEERDRELESKLRAEGSGILQWAINGCLEWQRVGLNPPEIVREATREYLDSEDVIARWIADCCITSSKFSVRSTALFESYKEWCDRTGEKAKSQKKLSSTLKERGFKVESRRDANFFAGIGLRTDIGGNQGVSQ